MIDYRHLADVETEKDLLGSMMSRPDEAIPKVRAEILADDFFRQSHRELYVCLLAMYQEHKPIDITTVAPYLQSRGVLDKVGGLPALTDIYGKALGIGALDSYISTVKDRARRRNAVQLMDVAIAQALDLSEDLDMHDFQSKLAKVAQDRYVAECSMQDVALEFLTEVEERAKEDAGDFCVMSGLKMLDSLLHGFRRQELIYIAARPSMGKSALAIQIAVDAAMNQGKRIMYVSLEMGKRQIFGRAVANLAKINSETVMYDSNLANSPKYAAVFDAANKLSQIGLYIKTQDVNTPRGIYNQALQVQGKHGLDAIIIDHVHLMDSGARRDSDNQNANMSRISKALKAMAIDLDVPVIALAQLSRGVETRNDKRPLLSDLRDSGTLEQDADKVLMLYRESYYDETARDDIVQILVRKQRDGRLGSVNVNFTKQYSRMEEPEFGGSYEDSGFTPPA